MPILLEQELNHPLQKMHEVRQIFDKSSITDPRRAVLNELASNEAISSSVCANMRVAIAVGSRGIGCLPEVVRAVADFLKERGAIPFIVTAMGSHGSGIAEGQEEILRGYGITEERMGVPIRAGVDVVRVGNLQGGKSIYTDRIAYKEADMTVIINRVKAHTDFDGDIESGLIKMSVIGLGNHIGCTEMHRSPFSEFPSLLKEASHLLVKKAHIGFGVAIVENAVEEPLAIEAIHANLFEESETRLLRLAKAHMPRLLLPKIDVLIVDEIGKNISGNGMDPNVVGRFGPKQNAAWIPDIGYLIVLGLTEESHGNAIGIGLANLTTRDVFDKIDFEATYANCIASGSGYESAFIPFILKDKKEAIAAALKMWGGDPIESKIVHIRNTLNLEHIFVSDALLDYVKHREDQFELL